MFTDALCGCYYDGAGPVWTEKPVTPPYTQQQTISLSEDGTVRVDKCGHWVSRALNGEIKKDVGVQ